MWRTWAAHQVEFIILTFILIIACLSVCLWKYPSVCSEHLSAALSLTSCLYTQTIPLWISQMQISLPFRGCVRHTHLLLSHNGKIRLLMFIHIFQKIKSFFFFLGREIKMTNMRNVINHHISHSLPPNIPSIFLSRFLLSLPLLGQQQTLSCSHLFLRPLRPSLSFSLVHTG